MKVQKSVHDVPRSRGDIILQNAANLLGIKLPPRGTKKTGVLKENVGQPPRRSSRKMTVSRRLLFNSVIYFQIARYMLCATEHFPTVATYGFYRVMLCIVHTMLQVVYLSVCPPVLSITCHYCIKTAKHIVKTFSPLGSCTILVFKRLTLR